MRTLYTVKYFTPSPKILSCKPLWPTALLLLASAALQAQCPAVAADLATELRCATRQEPLAAQHELDAEHSYTLSELIDIAERSHPRTRIAWEQARAAAERTGLARSEYLPHLAGMATFLNQKIINPFPRPLAPHGYTMVEMPVAEAGLSLGYTLLDFGRRHAQLEESKAQALASAAHFERENQSVAFAVITAYHRLTNAQQKLTARRQILETAQTIEHAAEAQLANGRATLPDLLDARAGRAKAEFELEDAIGEEQSARVTLRESLGIPPSDQIRIAAPAAQGSESDSAPDVQALVDQALASRPDLAALAERLKAANLATDQARSAYLPTVDFNARGSVQAIWPTVSKQDGSALADTAHFVWETGLTIHWDFFDGGARRSHLLVAQSEAEKSAEEKRDATDAITRATWTAWVGYRTAARRMTAAESLLTAASSSYSSSLEAYNYGVKNLIDLVHAEQQLAEARLAVVEARSALLTAQANLGYTTGTLLRSSTASPSEVIQK